MAAVTAADLTYNRLRYWLLSRGTLVTSDQAFGAYPNVGGSGSTLNIHEMAGRSMPGPAGSWLDALDLAGLRRIWRGQEPMRQESR